MIIPDGWMPKAAMSRIVTHWTVGTGEPSKFEADHYHFLISATGVVSRGRWPLTANEVGSSGFATGEYAAHVGNANSGAIGVSMCGMIGAEGPHRLGNFPLNQAQWDSLVSVCAQLCSRYSIQPVERFLLGHCEVKRVLGKDQKGKWDPWLGFAGIKQVSDVPARNWADVEKGWKIIGDRFRAEVALRMAEPRQGGA